MKISTEYYTSINYFRKDVLQSQDKYIMIKISGEEYTMNTYILAPIIIKINTQYKPLCNFKYVACFKKNYNAITI